MELELKELVWDSFNTEHILKHKITPGEVVQACASQLEVLKTKSNRLLLIGKTEAGRILSIVLAPKGASIYYPVTARAVSRKEKRFINEKDK